MKGLRRFLFVLFAAAPLAAQAPAGQIAKPAPRPPIFDPARDAAKDIGQAVAEAAKSGKRVLVDVGGNWCSWCYEMERYFETHSDLRALRDRNFVTVKVNYSPDNRNEAVLSKWPAIRGYPHLFVLDSKGELLHSQDTSELEDGKRSYDLDKFTSFLAEWAGARPGKI